jgi:hypothetical protein
LMSNVTPSSYMPNTPGLLSASARLPAVGMRRGNADAES